MEKSVEILIPKHFIHSNENGNGNDNGQQKFIWKNKREFMGLET